MAKRNIRNATSTPTTIVALIQKFQCLIERPPFKEDSIKMSFEYVVVLVYIPVHQFIHDALMVRVYTKSPQLLVICQPGRGSYVVSEVCPTA